RELPGGHPAPIDVTVAQDREPLSDPLPEGPHTRREQRKADQEQDREHGQDEQREAHVRGEEADVERRQLRKVRRLGEDALGEREAHDQRPYETVEYEPGPERRGDRA